MTKAASREICLQRVSEAADGMAALLRNLATDRGQSKADIEELNGLADMLTVVYERTDRMTAKTKG